MTKRLIGLFAVLTLAAAALGAAGIAAGCNSTTNATTSAGAGGSGAGGGASVCSDDATCGADRYCDFDDGLCGGGEVGSCVDTQGGCSTGTGPYPLVCGCDGGYHAIDCIAAEGTDRHDSLSYCGDPPANHLICGDFVCTPDSFCEFSAAGDASCRPNNGCTTCDCLEVFCESSTCDDSGELPVVTCG